MDRTRSFRTTNHATMKHIATYLREVDYGCGGRQVAGMK